MGINVLISGMKINLKEIGGRFRQIRGNKSLIDFERIAGISKNMISLYERGEAWPKPDILCNILEYGGKSFDWLFLGQDNMTIAENSPNYLPPSDYTHIDVFSMAGAGAPHTLTEYEPIDTLTIPTKLMKTGIVPVKVRGRSMEPNIFNGAIVGIDTTDKALVSGEIYGIWLPYEGAVIRRVTMSFDHITLQPDNEMFIIPRLPSSETNHSPNYRNPPLPSKKFQNNPRLPPAGRLRHHLP